jgi:Transmembrane secretion effector
MKFPSSFHAIARALGHRDFAIYTAGNAVSLVGTWMQRLATGWLTWELTGSGAWLGVVAFADLFPTILVGRVAGAAADRWDRLKVTRATQTLALCQSAILFALTATGAMTVELLVVLTAAGGLRTFGGPFGSAKTIALEGPIALLAVDGSALARIRPRLQA